MGLRGATALRCSCRSRWNCPSCIWRRFAPAWCRSRCLRCSARMRWSFGCRIRAPKPSSPTRAGWEKLRKIRDRLPDLRDVYVISDAAPAGAKPFWSSLKAASAEFATVDTLADDPAMIIYTSGTTGNPKGALHAPSRGARPSAECRDVPRFPAQARRPDVDAGRLGLDRRPDQRAARRAGIMACRSSGIARASSSRRRRCR